MATDQREVTLSACLQLPACSQIKQTHYMKLRRTTTKNKNHSRTKLITKANLKPGRQHKTNEILNSSEFSISTRSLPQEGSAYQASRSTLISVGETARSSHNASIPSGLHAQPKNKWDPFDSVTCTMDLPQKTTQMKASHDLQHLSFLSLIYRQRTKKSTVLLRIMRGFKTIPGSQVPEWTIKMHVEWRQFSASLCKKLTLSATLLRFHQTSPRTG